MPNVEWTGGNFAVMSSCAKMPSSCRGKYRNVALVELTEPGVFPAMISKRARAIKRIVERGIDLHAGMETSRSQFGKVRDNLIEYGRSLAGVNGETAAECFKREEREAAEEHAREGEALLAEYRAALPENTRCWSVSLRDIYGRHQVALREHLHDCGGSFVWHVDSVAEMLRIVNHGRESHDHVYHA